MFDTALRPIKERILLPFAKFLAKYISPNKMTMISLVLGILAFFTVLLGLYKIALICWVLNRITDGLDGTIARISETQSDYGGYIDIMSDFLIYAIIPIAFVMNRGFIKLETILLVFMLAAFYINSASWMYLSAILEKRNYLSQKSLTSVNMPKGLAEGFETIIIYTLFFILPDQIVILFIVISVLALIGSIQRIIWAKKEIK
ncbi:MAG: CDP-alcohol phosphatidyltransferase family protein [Spirochaetaceae bacterium]